MKISLFGLGYVGCVSMGCLSKLGHRIVGVDISQHKVDLINAGKPTIIEEGIDELIAEGVKNGLVSATVSSDEAVTETDISFICVGTPVAPTGQMNLNYVFAVAKDIGLALAKKDTFHVVAIRSTVLPGTCAKVAEIIASTSGKQEGKDFALISNPEFLREGSAVADYFDPSVTVIGSDNAKATEMAKEIYNSINAPIEEVPVNVAETIKFVNNAWHAVKISFANEVGGICKEVGVDSHAVMTLFAKDTKLNLGKAYTRPGFAYGGSCLPKDLSGLVHMGRRNYVDVPMLDSVSNTNESLKRKAVQLVLSKQSRNVAILGLSFKEGTDDLRFSPYVDLAEGLIGKGIEIRIFDLNVAYTNLLGINKAYVDEHLPHFTNLLSSDLDEVLAHADVVVISHKDKDYADLPAKYPKKHFIELSKNAHTQSYPNLEGINW